MADRWRAANGGISDETAAMRLSSPAALCWLYSKGPWGWPVSDPAWSRAWSAPSSASKQAWEYTGKGRQVWRCWKNNRRRSTRRKPCSARTPLPLFFGGCTVMTHLGLCHSKHFGSQSHLGPPKPRSKTPTRLFEGRTALGFGYLTPPLHQHIRVL